eukprot:4849775-Karenia_brevis.AAC.1
MTLHAAHITIVYMSIKIFQLADEFPWVIGRGDVAANLTSLRAFNKSTCRLYSMENLALTPKDV